MATPNLKNLGHKVVTQQRSWAEMVRRSWGAEFSAPDHGVYEFSNGRQFDSTDRGNTGVYGVIIPHRLMLDLPTNLQYPDMALSVLQLEDHSGGVETES